MERLIERHLVMVLLSALSGEGRGEEGEEGKEGRREGGQPGGKEKG